MQLRVFCKRLGVASAAIVAVVMCPSQSRAAAPSYTLLHKSTTLAGEHSSQQMLVERLLDQRFVGDKTAAAKFKSSNSSVATVDEKGVVRPAGNGDVTIPATVDGQVATAAIKVNGAGQNAPRSF